MSRQAGAFIGLTAVVSFLMGLVVAGTRPPLPSDSLPERLAANQRPLMLSEAPAPSAGSPTSIAPTVDFAAVSARVNAAVVNVDTAARSGETRSRSSRGYGADDGSSREASGSGFIIDQAGFILTNDHVVSGADRVTVTLSDGRTYRADVVGVDPAIDVALLQIHAREPLPTAILGNSDTLRMGEWVCAIGNPLGVYVHSVTVGVVSFLGRKLFDPSLDAFIQTDAAISFGNSGGPLINARGEVVGITTAISAQAPNIGFAIPITQVVNVLQQLREHGSVARGFIGIGLTNVTPTLRRALQLEPLHGALVQDVPADTPADQAGLRAYDVVVKADGRPVQSDEELIRYISTRQPGTLATLDVWRDGETRQLQIKLRDRPLPDAVRRRVGPEMDVRPASASQAPLGLTVTDLDEKSIDRLRLPDTLQGVRVIDVDPAGPSRLARITVNQVILEINRHRVTSSADFRAIVAGLKPGEATAVLIYDRTLGQKLICTVMADSGS
jgi:serine protease Do